MAVDEINLIRNLAIVLFAALAGGWLFRFLKQSSITGYLLAGIIIGPYALGFITQTNDIQILATIGVILLFFTLGVKFTLREISAMGAVSTWGTFLQIIFSAGLGLAVAWFLGFPIIESITFGLIISLSSTILAISILTERGELDSVHGRVIIGFMLVQDIASAFMMFIFPVLSGTQSSIDIWSLLWAALRATGFLAGILILGRWVVPRIIRRVAGSRGSRELLVIASIMLCFSAAFGAFYFGLSAALGAFALGLLIAGSDFSHQVLGDMSAMRDIFAAIFFVSVGMLIDIPAVGRDITAIIIIVSTIMLGKFIVSGGVVRLFGYKGRTIPLVGAGILQIGEFSFVLAQLALSTGAISTRLYELILASAVISIVLTPTIYGSVSYLNRRFVQSGWTKWLLGSYNVSVETGPTSRTNHVVVCGNGRVGSKVTEMLDSLKIPYLVIELDPAIIRTLRQRNIPCIYGDAGNREVLRRANLDQAAMLVVAMPDPTAARLILDRAREVKPDLDIVIRVHSQFEIEYLQGRGASELVQAEFEIGLEIVRHIVCHFGYTDEQVMALIDSHRRTCPS